MISIIEIIFPQCINADVWQTWFGLMSFLENTMILLFQFSVQTAMFSLYHLKTILSSTVRSITY